MVNLLSPIRLGEIIRIIFMKQAGQPGAATLSTIIVEKGLDLTAAGVVAAALVVLAVTPAWLWQQSAGLALAGLLLPVGLILLWSGRRQIERGFAAGLARASCLPERWRQHILAISRTMLQTFEAIAATPSTLGWVLFWTMMAWLLSLLTMMTLFAAFHLTLPLTAVLLMVLAVHSSNILPSPPALVGLMQVIAVVVLGQYGLPRSEAVGFGLILNIVTVAPIIILGSWALLPRLASILTWTRQYQKD
jgi:uncharacterized protein (TIRG00374 family)